MGILVVDGCILPLQVAKKNNKHNEDFHIHESLRTKTVGDSSYENVN